MKFLQPKPAKKLIPASLYSLPDNLIHFYHACSPGPLTAVQKLSAQETKAFYKTDTSQALVIE